MTFLDYLILTIYAVGMLFIGGVLSKYNKKSADMFAVSKQSPWWLSGLSAFMSAFSAGTFVVWGGIAYKQGMVAVSICMCSGVSSLLVGRFFAKKWAGLGINSVGEYVNLRFGKEAVQFYTWVGMIFKIVAMGVALYAFSTLLCALIPLSPNNFFCDPTTGNLSKMYATVLSGLLMLVYAVSGGLWAVLIIDSIQFVVLTVSVIFVVPLCFEQVGGIQGFINRAPEGFLSPTSGNFTYLFLVGWVIVHTFKLGGEWVFIQRFLAVSSARNAQKSSYLFGFLYLVSPILWMLPPMAYRIINPNVNPEQAYFLACSSVLPAGMMGLLLAAMFSSAASYIDGEVNVYAGAVTNDFYKAVVNPTASERQLVLVGRISSFLIGAIIIGVAVVIPYLGGAEKVILTITSLLVVSMVLPVLWGLYFGKIRQNAVWVSTGASFMVAILVKFGIPTQAGNPFSNWFKVNAQILEVALGIFVPLSILALMEAREKENTSGYLKLKNIVKKMEHPLNQSLSIFPAQILAYSMGILSLMMFGVAFYAKEKIELVTLFGAVLMSISLAIIWGLKKLPILILLFSSINVANAQQPIQIKGVFPQMAVVADHKNRSEAGIGALVPWANKLWAVGYVAHITGSGVGLYEINADMTSRRHPLSYTGTYANRYIHNQSFQAFIGPYAIDTSGNVRLIEDLKKHRLTATMKHLSQPDSMVYFLTMEGLLFETNVFTLKSTQLADLVKELDIAKAAQVHFKGAFTQDGRVVVANNSYYEDDFLGKRAAGRLAEWNGKTWTILDKNPYVEVSGKNWSDNTYGNPIYATGWDRSSAILKFYKKGVWKTYRLPKASYAYDHAWNTEWMRIREANTERYLMDLHGVFYELPTVSYAGNIMGIRPICNHLRIVPDFVSWRGLFVMASDQADNSSGQPQSGLWFGNMDELWSYGKPKGIGGVWYQSKLKAGEVSDPYLMNGFDQKTVHITNHSAQDIEITLEVDYLSNDTWNTYKKVKIPANGYQYHVFENGFSAQWIRAKVDKAAEVTVQFTYN